VIRGALTPSQSQQPIEFLVKNAPKLVLNTGFRYSSDPSAAVTSKLPFSLQLSTRGAGGSQTLFSNQSGLRASVRPQTSRPQLNTQLAIGTVGGADCIVNSTPRILHSRASGENTDQFLKSQKSPRSPSVRRSPSSSPHASPRHVRRTQSWDSNTANSQTLGELETDQVRVPDFSPANPEQTPLPVYKMTREREQAGEQVPEQNEPQRPTTGTPQIYAI
jgi:hypothetical protein